MWIFKRNRSGSGSGRSITCLADVTQSQELSCEPHVRRRHANVSHETPPACGSLRDLSPYGTSKWTFPATFILLGTFSFVGAYFFSGCVIFHLFNFRFLCAVFICWGKLFLSLLVFSLSMLRIICLVPYFVRRAVFCSAC